MMKKNLLLLVVALFCNVAQADSFLTSTEFCEAYQNKKIIKEAKNSLQLNEKLITYILKKRKPIAIKLAIINQLGWDFRNRKKNSEIFLKYIIAHKLFNDYDDLVDNADEEILITLAYMKAMENYFVVTDALRLGLKARSMDKKNKKSSYALNMVCSLIEAQNQLHKNDFCGAFKLCDAVRTNKALKRDMNRNARRIVFDYVDIYEEDCEK